MARRLTDKQRAEIADLFDLYDEDESGTIDISELPTLLRALGFTPTNAFCEQLMRKYDANADGTLGLEEFMTLVATEPLPGTATEAELLRVFKLFDLDGNGTVSSDELVSAMTARGEPISLDEARAMVARVDTDGDRELNFAEFAAMMRGASITSA